MAELTEFQKKLTAIFPDMELRMNEPLSKHTSFRIGGPAAAMVFPQSTQQLSEVLKQCEILDVKYTILGAGTNVLAPDSGISNLVICLKDSLDGMYQLDDTAIRVMGGVTMTRAALFAAGLGLSGMEFAHGIPGTVGGGVYMNAGAYGGEICEICRQVGVLRPNGKLEELSADQMHFSYRHSCLEDEPGVVVYADFELTKAPAEQIRSKMQELMSKRKASQPLDLPSAGSAFKRPVGGYAAALIDQTGLKGFRIGDAAVSEKHAGFVVNLGSATAEDVKALLDSVSRQVYLATGIRLEPEVRIW